MGFKKERFGKSHTRYWQLPVFAAHERDGVDVDEAWLKECARKLRDNEKAGHLYDVVLTHESEKSVGHLSRATVGRSPVVVGDQLRENHPTLFADVIVKNSVAKQIDRGDWPRRSVVAHLRAKTIKNCALLGAEDSWFGLPDHRPEYYDGTDRVGGSEWACYAREDENDMPDALKENEAESMPPGEEYPEGEHDTDDSPKDDSEDSKPEMEETPEKSDREILMLVLGLIEKLAGAAEPAPMPEPEVEPMPMPEPPPDDEGMMAAESEADQFQFSKAVDEDPAVNYAVASDEALAKVAESGIAADPVKVRASYRATYKKYGRKAADHFASHLIKNGQRIPGAKSDPTDEVDQARADAGRLHKYTDDEMQVIRDASSAGKSPEVAGKKAENWRDYKLAGGSETLADYMKYGPAPV